MAFFEVLVKVRLGIYTDSLGQAVREVENLEKLSLVNSKGEESKITIQKADIYGVSAQHQFP